MIKQKRFLTFSEAKNIIKLFRFAKRETILALLKMLEDYNRAVYLCETRHLRFTTQLIVKLTVQACREHRERVLDMEQKVLM